MAVAALALATSCGAAAAEEHLRAMDAAYGALGLMQLGYAEGHLAGGGEQLHRAEIGLLQCYQVVALGDPGMSGLEIEVRTPQGRSLGRHAAADGIAAFRLCPEGAGDHEVILRSSVPGKYRLAMWGRPDDSCAGARALRLVPPEGDGAGSRPSLLVGEGTTTDGLENLGGSCINGTAPEHVYEVEVTERSWFEAELSSRFDGALYLLTSCGLSGSEIACNDDWDDASNARLATILEPSTYFLVVDGYGGTAGDYELEVRLTGESVVADVCRQAPTIQPGPGTPLATGATDVLDASCSPRGGGDVFRRLDVPRLSLLTLEHRADGASPGDGGPSSAAIVVRPTNECTGEELRRMSLGYESELACQVGRLTTVLDPGSYLVQVQTEDGGDLALARKEVVLQNARPASEACGDGERPAYRLTPDLPVAGSTVGQVDLFDGGCLDGGGGDETYVLNVPAPSRVEIDLYATFDGGLHLRTDCVPNGTGAPALATSGAEVEGDDGEDAPYVDPLAGVLDCNDDWENTTRSHIDLVLAPGRYFVIVDGFDGDAGNYVLHATLHPAHEG